MKHLRKGKKLNTCLHPSCSYIGSNLLKVNKWQVDRGRKRCWCT